MTMHKISLLALLGFLTLALQPAFAQTAPKPFTVQAFAIDAKTIAGGNMTISLWGIEAATATGTMENTRARVALDDLINDKPVRCMPMGTINGTTRAQCLNAQERDIALTLLSAGLVTARRADLIGSDIANAYLTAERTARAQQIGIWGNNKKPATDDSAASTGFDIQGLAGAVPAWAVAGALLIVPMIGFLAMALIMSAGFRQLITLQKYQLAGTQKRERQLKEREKYVIASAIEGELNTNRAKLDAFLTIYEELLKSLRDPSKTPKYQRAGDIIHEKPTLSRTVFDAHIDKLDLLGPQLGSELTSLYSHIDAAPDYRTLEPELPIEKARETVDRILRSATKMAEPMDKMIAALSIIVRDKRGAITTE